MGLGSLWNFKILISCELLLFIGTLEMRNAPLHSATIFELLIELIVFNTIYLGLF